ncbi:VOC family protein [Pelomonas sp. KK5]|uniref:VOC family protein n=1 Tax=Pelomonas sp. KK5 TaxID=1855730 RepID=UPI00097BF955|nr:VOC family protein [Pelomonas sp. KK5]
MDVMQTHGAFSWSELMTDDPAKAADFYAGLFGWTVEAMEMPGMTYRVAKVNGTPIAGMMACPDPSQKMPPNWSCYGTVDAVDETVKQWTAKGGTVLMPPTDIPTVGRMACLRDPQGAVINVITYVKQ